MNSFQHSVRQKIAADAQAIQAAGKDKIDVTGLGADMPSLSGATISFLGNLDYQNGTVAVAGTTVNRFCGSSMQSMH